MNFRSETVGIDPDKDYLLDPQQIPVYPGRCDCCGYSIQRGDRFYQLPFYVQDWFFRYIKVS